MRTLSKIVSTTFGVILLSVGINVVNAANPLPDPIQTTKPDCSSTNSTPDMAIEGRRAYMRMNCYSCHGMRALGGGMGPTLVGKANSVSAVTGGDGHGMPSYRNNLCSKDINNLSAYLRLLGTGTDPSFTHWWEKGMPSR